MNIQKENPLTTYIISIAFSFLFLLQSPSAIAQCCSYTLSMRDSYGDGWNGGFLQVIINGNLVGTYSASGYASTSAIDICNGDMLELVYTPNMYEEENSYQLYDPSWNLVFADGPNPQTNSVFSSIGDCNGILLQGGHPCTALAIDTGQCIVADNSLLQSSGLKVGCADFKGGDMWFVLQIPPSGNVSIATDSGSINDTGIAAWTNNTCSNLRYLGCDDDAGVDYFSFLTLYDLPPGQNLFIQVFGYGGAKGSFKLCVEDLGTVSFDSSELPIVVINTLGQTIVSDTKINCLMDIKYNGENNITYLTDAANVYSGNIGIEIRGASSSGYPQQPFGLETRTATGENNDVSILGMPAEHDWVLLSNFNDRSLVRNSLAYKLFGEMGNYSVRTSLCEVVIDSSYKGIYVFGEKIKRDKNRIDIAKLAKTDIEGDQLTGGYILQQNYWNEQTSFLSNYSPIDHPDFPVHFVYEYPKPDSILDVQKSYIASFVDSLEQALYSEDFASPDHGYRQYLDVKSFIDYFLLNELARNNDGFKKSVFFNKDRFSKGGKLKAGPVWDFDWAWKNMYGCVEFENTDGSGWAYHINDCPTDNYSCGWYVRLLQDSTFTDELRCTYQDYRQTILDTAYIFAYIDSVHTLVENAQSRHFQKWPILGISGPAPETGAIATTYAGELDTLKAWINLRLEWLDDNLPGLCSPVSIGVDPNDFQNALRYFPNPGSGNIHFEGILNSPSPLEMTVYTTDGRIIDRKRLTSGHVQFEYQLNEAGVYYFTITSNHGIVQYGKMLVL